MLNFELMMPSEAITAATRPPFPTYLLPSLNFPLPSPFRSARRRQSAASASSTVSASSLSASPTSPISSANTSPSSSPPYSAYFNKHCQPCPTLTSATKEGQIESVENKNDFEQRLTRAQPDTLKCSTCSTDLAFASQIISKGFTGRHGRAYLVSPPQTLTSPANPSTAKQDRDLVNTKVGRSVNRQLVTGAHVVADISCVVCGTVVGWKYVDAKETAQKYKIGKFILETRRIVGGKNWEDMGRHPLSYRDYLGDGELVPRTAHAGKEEAVLFDSEDEDECDDLFAGVWDPEAVGKRRRRRIGSRRRDE